MSTIFPDTNQKVHLHFVSPGDRFSKREDCVLCEAEAPNLERALDLGELKVSLRNVHPRVVSLVEEAQEMLRVHYWTDGWRDREWEAAWRLDTLLMEQVFLLLGGLSPDNRDTITFVLARYFANCVNDETLARHARGVGLGWESVHALVAFAFWVRSLRFVLTGRNL